MLKKRETNSNRKAFLSVFHWLLLKGRQTSPRRKTSCVAEMPSKPNKKTDSVSQNSQGEFGLCSCVPASKLEHHCTFFVRLVRKKAKNERSKAFPLKKTARLSRAVGCKKKIDIKKRFVENLAWLKVVSDVGCFFLFPHSFVLFATEGNAGIYFRDGRRYTGSTTLPD